jgi:PIN domain nuclease of toxin-antitoxin system
VRYLLDTHVWLWLHTEPERVNATTLALLQQPENDRLLSAACTWEIAIKYALGKLPLPEVPSTYVPSRMQLSADAALPVTITHTLHVATLPTHHRDPFDRILVAQAQLEDLTVVTADPIFSRYDIPVIMAV